MIERGRQPDRLAGLGRLARPPAGDRVVDAEIAHDPQQGRDVGEPRHIAELERLVGQKARDHQRQGRVLGPRDRDRAVERRAAPDANAIHQDPPVMRVMNESYAGCQGSRLVGRLVALAGASPLARPSSSGGRRGLAAARLSLAAFQVFFQSRCEPVGFSCDLTSDMILATHRRHHQIKGSQTPLNQNISNGRWRPWH